MNLYRKYLSHLVPTIALLIMASSIADAQRDTTGTAARKDSIVEYLTPLEYAFMMHEETRFMLRLPAIGVGAEVEIFPYFTLMGQVYFPQTEPGNTYYYNLDSEMRWYYGSRKKGVRNMFSNYFALGYKNQTKYSSLTSSRYRENFFYGRWGMQRRFIGNGLLDIGFNAGYNSMPKHLYKRFNDFFVQSTGLVGLGFVFNKEKILDPEKLCSVVKCYEKETFLLKLNTSNLFSIYHSAKNNDYRINIQPETGLEQKLFSSSFSIGADFKLNYNWQKVSFIEGGDYIYNYGFLSGKVQARYYYNLKNRIRKGKSGNGFSANYFSGGYYKEFYIKNHGSEHVFKKNFEGIMITTGVQRTFGKHFFFDVELGGAVDTSPKYYNDFQFFGNVQLGIKF